MTHVSLHFASYKIRRPRWAVRQLTSHEPTSERLRPNGNGTGRSSRFVSTCDVMKVVVNESCRRERH